MIKEYPHSTYHHQSTVGTTGLLSKPREWSWCRGMGYSMSKLFKLNLKKQKAENWNPWYQQQKSLFAEKMGKIEKAEITYPIKAHKG